MAEYSDQVCVMSCPTGNFNTMPRSYSVSSTKPNHLDDDRREPLRAASTRSNLGSRNSKINVDVPARQQYSHKKSATRLGVSMPRSHTVAIGRIDEEKPCDFDEEDVKVKTNVYPRSRSYAVSKRWRRGPVVPFYLHFSDFLVLLFVKFGSISCLPTYIYSTCFSLSSNFGTCAVLILVFDNWKGSLSSIFINFLILSRHEEGCLVLNWKK